MDMKAASTVDRRLIAHDFHNATHGKVDEKIVQSAIAELLDDTATHMYAASCSVASFGLYVKFKVHCTHDDKTFDGNSGALSSAGPGKMWGTIYTKDIDRLYQHTHAFEWQGSYVYMSILFFDHHHNLLGHFQAGGVSTIIGTGGGTGSW